MWTVLCPTELIPSVGSTAFFFVWLCDWSTALVDIWRWWYAFFFLPSHIFISATWISQRRTMRETIFPMVVKRIDKAWQRTGFFVEKGWGWRKPEGESDSVRIAQEKSAPIFSGCLETWSDVYGSGYYLQVEMLRSLCHLCHVWGNFSLASLITTRRWLCNEEQLSSSAPNKSVTVGLGQTISA